MKPDAYKAIDKFRITFGKLGSTSELRNNGAFIVPLIGPGKMIAICDDVPGSWHINLILSDQGGWDHVSVSLRSRCPTWYEMAFVKDLLFEPHEVAMQLHPAKSDYINHNPNVLHIWRPHDKRIPLPPLDFV